MLAFFTVASFAQGVRGTIVDETGDPLPNVSIYMPSERVGTTTNVEGRYEIQLQPGEYDLVFQSLGFSQREFKLTIRKTWIELDLALAPQSYQLGEVVVNPGSEDPAYAIVRKAIVMAPYYLRQTQRYNAEVYLKGSFRMDKIPRLLRNSLTVQTNEAEVKVEEGRTYTMESMNEISFIAPDTFQHTVLASRSSFPAGDESTVLGFINSSFYEPDNGMVISPLAPQAMRHYKFRYEGFFEEADVEVNKIRVIPKRKSQQLVNGYVYIVQDLWNLHSIDVEVEMFFGNVAVRQVFQPVKENAWLPVTHQFDLDVSVMGMKAMVDYSGSVRYKEVYLNEELKVPDNLISSQNLINEEDAGKAVVKTKDQQKIAGLLDKEDLNNRDMMKLARLMEKTTDHDEDARELELSNTYKMEVKKDSVKRDPAFWDSMRSVPLTPLEQKSFALGDSLAALKINQNDSVRSEKAGFLARVAGFASRGKRFYLADSSIFITYPGFICLGNVNFNPVDGWSYKQSIDVKWKQDSVHRLELFPEAAYTFSRDAWMWHVLLKQTYAPLQRGEFGFSAGDETTDFKSSAIAVNRWTDMSASLFFKENYKRYFGRRFVEFFNGLDLANGLRWAVSARYEWITPVVNHSNYSFFSRNEYYSANMPGNDQLDVSNLEQQESLSWSSRLSYTPGYFYRISKGRKVMSHSSYPTFSLSLKQGLPVFDSEADYFMMEADVEQEKETGVFPALSWVAGGGWFARNDGMHFSHFKHFNASRLPVRITSSPAFRLLNDYEASTNKWYLRGHLKYSSPYLLLKHLPVLSNRLWQESLHFDYLHTPQLKNYMQAGYSLDQLFFMGSIGVFVGFEDGHYKHWGVGAVLAF